MRRIFVAKSRPASNPLIVHLASLDRLADAIAWPPSETIARQIDALEDLWPGPLTIVCPRCARIPDEVTAGRATVAVRIPAHPVARQILQECPFPLAAPSANRSRYISPTVAEHVCDRSGLAAHVAMVIDGGPSVHGVESTIVALGDSPRLLRPGTITAEQIADRLKVNLSQLQAFPGSPSAATGPDRDAEWVGPGMMREHYCPTTPLILLCGNRAALDENNDLHRVGRISFGPLAPAEAARYRAVETLSESGDLVEIARYLFAALRRMDEEGLDAIHCDTCSPTGLGLAIMDRLSRAAAGTGPASQGAESSR